MCTSGQMAEQRQRQGGMPIVVIDPHRNRTAESGRSAPADQASAPMPRSRSASCTSWCATASCAERDYLAKHTLGFDQVEREILPKFPPERVGGDHRACRRRRRETRFDVRHDAKAASSASAEGMTRLTHGGQAMRTVALLPASPATMA